MHSSLPVQLRKGVMEQLGGTLCPAKADPSHLSCIVP